MAESTHHNCVAGRRRRRLLHQVPHLHASAQSVCAAKYFFAGYRTIAATLTMDLLTHNTQWGVVSVVSETN